MSCGIYIISNKINNKVYIGQSKTIEDRLHQHKYNLRHNKHKNIHLQNSWNKYGELNFDFDIIELCEVENLDCREKYYINQYKSYEDDFGYNIEHGGRAGNKGKRFKECCYFNNASLDEETVRHIKLCLYNLMTREEICDLFNVSMCVVKSIAEIKNYYYVCEELNDKIKNIKSNMTEEHKAQAINLYNEGYTITEIVDIIGCTKGIIEHAIYDKGLHLDRKAKKEEKRLHTISEVIRLHDEGYINYRIAKILKISPSSVQRYLEKYANTEVN